MPDCSACPRRLPRYQQFPRPTDFTIDGPVKGRYCSGHQFGECGGSMFDFEPLRPRQTFGWKSVKTDRTRITSDLSGF